jgi:hypothetical protein
MRRLTFRQVEAAGKRLGMVVEKSDHREYETWKEGDSSMVGVAHTIEELWTEVWNMAPQEKREEYGLEVLTRISRGL